MPNASKSNVVTSGSTLVGGGKEGIARYQGCRRTSGGGGRRRTRRRHRQRRRAQRGACVRGTILPTSQGVPFFLLKRE